MIKKSIKYFDIDGIERTEDFYFNLTKAEIIELQVSHAGGFLETLQALSVRNAPAEHLALIKETILAAYGERTEVGRHFIKKPEFAEAFSHTEAFSILFMEMFEDAKKAEEFFTGLLPKDLMDQARAEQAGQKARPATQDHMSKHTVDGPIRVVGMSIEEGGLGTIEPASPRTVTREQLTDMTVDQITDFFTTGGVVLD